jgi:peptidoglycan hydrolase-like protein with peptidoglycan-binding domain
MLEGQTSTCISLLQLSLNKAGSYNLSTDGSFGAATRTAVLDFQGRNGLPADGNAGSEVAAALIGQVGDHNVVDLGRSNPSAGVGVGASASAEISSIPAENCQSEEFASLGDYISGKVKAPACFPYQPKIKDTAAGPRALDPFNDGCSGPTPLDKVPFVYDFRDACATHDYAYDLLRYGVNTFREPDADNQLWRDWLSDCKGRSVAAAAECADIANKWRAGVRFGNVEPGDHITSD